jgi:glycerol-3-phosphate dehydrogenase
VIGGGINGLASAWALLQAGHDVTLFERDRLMGATSSASTKLLHGGLRYLEHGQIRLVYEALHERNWWLRQVPELTRPLRLAVPVYRGGGRPRWKLKAGLWLYDRLAGAGRIGSHRWHTPEQLAELAPGLDMAGLAGGYTFFDGQMDDYRLGLWVADRVRELGGVIREQEAVTALDSEGGVTAASGSHRFDRVVNVAGPWAEALNRASGVPCGYTLDLIRGSHIVFDEPLEAGFLLESPRDKRAFFALPYFSAEAGTGGRTLVGTTEVRQRLDDPIACSEAERDYLLAAYNHYFDAAKGSADVAETFAGVRPLIRAGDDPTRVSREYKLERRGRLLTVYGGKWTTARRLGQAVTRRIEG